MRQHRHVLEFNLNILFLLCGFSELRLREFSINLQVQELSAKVLIGTPLKQPSIALFFLSLKQNIIIIDLQILLHSRLDTSQSTDCKLYAAHIHTYFVLTIAIMAMLFHIQP